METYVDDAASGAAFNYRHQWRRGNVLLWDNCLVRQRAIQA